jgi:hypothetical protein
MAGSGKKGVARKKATASRKNRKRTAKTTLDGLELRRLMSARAINDAVEQFHVFSVGCDDANALYTAFSAYRIVILEAMTLRRLSGGERLEADILLLNGTVSLEHAGTTNNTYGLYLPQMTLKRSGPSKYEAPQPQDGVATYAVYAGTTGRSGVAVHKDVLRKNAVTRFWEPVSATEYKQSSVGNMYKPPPSGTPPYKAILSAPIMMTLKDSRFRRRSQSPSASAYSTLRTRCRSTSLPRIARGRKPAHRWSGRCTPASSRGSLHLSRRRGARPKLRVTRMKFSSNEVGASLRFPSIDRADPHRARSLKLAAP